MRKTIKAILAPFALSIFCSVLCQQAQAQDPIEGAIQFFGSASASGASSGGGPTTIAFTDNWNTLQGTGDYSGVPFGTDAAWSDFTFTGDGTAATLTAAVEPLWIFTDGGLTYSFDLLSLTNGHSESGSMSFSGTGVVRITGFDDTMAAFGLQGSGNGFNFELSSSTTAAIPAAIPEVGTTAVLALGLLLVAVEARRRTRRTS